MTTFLQLGTFYINWKEIQFFEEVGDGHLHIWTRDSTHRRINVFNQGAEGTDKVEVELAAPYYIQVKLAAKNFDKVRKALLTKVRGT